MRNWNKKQGGGNFDNDNFVISVYRLCYKLSGRDDIVLTKISNMTYPGIMSTQTPFIMRITSSQLIKNITTKHTYPIKFNVKLQGGKAPSPLNEFLQHNMGT